MKKTKKDKKFITSGTPDISSIPLVIVVNIIPTGIRCEIGGFIGDATQVTNLLAANCDYLITNPNAVNAGAFNFKSKNVLYVEGWAIDQLFKGQLGLLFSEKNSIGVIIERIPDKIAIKYTLKTIEAFSVVAGIEISGIEFIEPMPKKIKMIKKQFFGEINCLENLFQAAKKLRNGGASAIAITTHIPCPPRYLRSYQSAKIPNPYGQIEAFISHAVGDYLKIPAAHAPLLTKKEMDFFLFNSFKSDPRTAFENISCAYLGSVLWGLATAPQLTFNLKKANITLKDIKALIIPANCFRSIPVASALENDIPIIEVKENKNIFQIFPKHFFSKSQKIISVKTYQGACHLIRRLKSLKILNNY